jgi:hypothetical protein
LTPRKADVYPRNRTERSDLIDGSIGEGSPFEREFGYYAHGVDASTAVLPRGWEERLVLVCGANTNNIRGWCLEVHDLAVAKLVAGREKDRDFVGILARRDYIQAPVLRARLSETDVAPPVRTIAEARVRALWG